MQAPEANRNWKEDGKEKKNGSGVGSDKEEGGKEKIANRQRAIPNTETRLISAGATLRATVLWTLWANLG